MSEKFFGNLELKKESSEEPKEKWIVSALEQIKEKISGSKEKVKKTLILSSIPLMILAGESNIAQADELDELKTERQQIEQSQYSEKEKKEEVEKILKVGEEEKILTDSLSLNSIKNEEEKESLRERIGLEMTALNLVGKEFDKSLREAIKKNPSVVSEDIREKCAKNEPIFNFGKQMVDKIREAENFSQRDSKLSENPELSFKELAKIFPVALAGIQKSIWLHEKGHKEQALKEGAIYTNIDMGFLRGRIRVKGVEELSPRFEARALTKPMKFGKTLTELIKHGDPDNQIMAIFALTNRAHGFLYGARTLMDIGPHDDIKDYAAKLGISKEKVSIGLIADFLLNRDNWRLLRVALGEKGVEFPDQTIRFFYEIGSELTPRGEPIAGIKFQKRF